MKKYYIKERHNPQLGVYYVLMGQISKAEAKRYEKPGYGDNYMLPYDTEAEYTQAIEKLKAAGERVQ
jgi:radical SAM superfamily enzyme YgiQ (UPF0313 family)